MNFNEAVTFISNADTVSILPHLSADGDALGSAFSLKLMLDSIGKKTTVYLEEEVQKRYLFALEDIEYTIIDDISDLEEINSDLVIIVDCADIKRLGKRTNIYERAERTILIDHHEFNDGFAQINYVDPEWAATCIGVYNLIKQTGYILTDEIALLLYVGIVTDTGGFKHTNTNPEVHIIASELLKYNINPSLVSQNVFENMTHGRYMLNGEIIKRTEFFFSGKVCMCYLPQSVFDYYGAIDEDGEGIVDHLKNIEGVEVSVYIRNRGDGLKISMRAKNYVDVATIASLFSGGGHKRASGASWDGSYESLKEKLLTELGSVL